MHKNSLVSLIVGSAIGIAPIAGSRVIPLPSCPPCRDPLGVNSVVRPAEKRRFAMADLHLGQLVLIGSMWEPLEH